MSKNYLKFYYNQNNYENIDYSKPNGTKKTIKSSGCGVCCVAMAINNLVGEEIFKIKTLADLSKTYGARTNDGTNVKKLLEITFNALKDTKCDQFSVECTETTDKLIKHLQNGGVAILHQGNNYDVFSSQGHFVYAYGIDKLNIKVADSAWTENRYNKSPRCKRIVSKTKTGCIVNAEEVKKATTKISYYLITYKGAYYGDIIDSPCKSFNCNATMNKSDTVYYDNKRLHKIGSIKGKTRVKALGVGETNTIIQYGVDKSTYNTGIVYTKNINFDKGVI